MTQLTPYLHLPGTAREALQFYGSVFGGEVLLFSYAEFGRTDGPADAIAHGQLTGGPVPMFASDVAGEEPALRSEGLMLALLGTADPKTLRTWFDRLGDGGRVVDPLQKRPWGDVDGQVVDRHGLHWLVGFQQDADV
ncbi:MAG: VOC family protein [Candidatus Nanopelagicales bacterium]